MNQEEFKKALEAFGKGGITVAGDLVLEKHVEHEVNNVEAGGIGIQIVNGKEDTGNETHQPAGGDEQNQEIVEKLKPIFYGNEENARKFLSDIQGMKPTQITEKVNLLVGKKIISELSRKRNLWTVLHENGLYGRSEANWNDQVK